jgi:hypothetical protein
MSLPLTTSHSPLSQSFDAHPGRFRDGKALLKLKSGLDELLKTKGSEKDVKSEGWTSEFIENKGTKKVVLRVYRKQTS